MAFTYHTSTPLVTSMRAFVPFLIA